MTEKKAKYQIFTTQSCQEKIASRLRRLRAQLQRQNINGFLLRQGDEYQNEHIAAYAERLFWLTGFDGSAGLGIILPRQCALFVDGRYILQAAKQTDPQYFTTHKKTPEILAHWLGTKLTKGWKIGFDPWLHTLSEIEEISALCEANHCQLVCLEENPVDAIWRNRPARPASAIHPHPLRYAGKRSPEKCSAVAAKLIAADCQALLLTKPDVIAWLLNIRGQDVPHLPVILSYAILYADGQVCWFVARKKISARIRRHFGAQVTILPPGELPKALDQLQDKQIWADKTSLPMAIGQWLQSRNVQILWRSDPCLLARACKNPAEIAGAKAAHLRDGIAVTRFLHWLKQTKTTVDEITAACKLEQLRSESSALREIAFDTISAAGPNGAIIHYRVREESNRTLRKNELYLVDSGGQYLDGTTDITRTIILGNASLPMQRHFTLVLRGHIALANARFPPGAKGADLDILARRALWSGGLDYAHGTGHGVGSYLGVHEGPQNISRYGAVVLRPGMILSNEPGYYLAGQYGIRIENLMLVQAGEMIDGGEQMMEGFETLSLAPIDRELILVAMLSREERSWLDDYHAKVYNSLAPFLPQETKIWLEEVTQPL